MNTAFHVQMAGTCIALFLIAYVGCRFTDVKVPGVAIGAVGFFVLFVATLPILAYWWQKRRIYCLDAAITFYWSILLKVLFAYSVVIAARLGMAINLQDDHLVHFDQMLGVDVAQLSAWAHRYWIGQAANASYPLLPYFIVTAILLPILTHRVRYTQRFLTANVIAFAISLPIFALVPAVGPWYGIHFFPSEGQRACQNAFLLLRQPGPHVFENAGIICFPSFHAIWSVLCAYSLWGIRLLRVPVVVLSSLILFSTVSTGWHYFSDVAVGVVIAALSMAVSNRLSSQLNETQWQPTSCPTGTLPTLSSSRQVSDDICIQELD